ncbi:MAG: Sfum_1244 family protein [Gammaproteobacteria bacterium]
MTNTFNIKPILSNIQYNCNIADAKYAGNFTLCIYLLKMREYFRWEKGYGYSSNLPQSDVGQWLVKREALLSDLEDKEFNTLEINNNEIDPFDTQKINQHLVPNGYVYSAGLGQQAKPHFFLGALEEHRKFNGYNIYISDKEYARELSAYPAMSIGTDIFIRRESLRRMLWEKLETWRWNKPQNAMQRALEFYNFNDDVELALDEMTSVEIETTTLHEIGEIKAGELLGSKWQDLLISLPRCKAEIMLRAVRDHLADALFTIPALIENNQIASLHFYFANFALMRKELFPSLLEHYQTFVETKNSSEILEHVKNSKDHWLNLANNAIKLHDQQNKNSNTAITKLEELIQNNIL